MKSKTSRWRVVSCESDMDSPENRVSSPSSSYDIRAYIVNSICTGLAELEPTVRLVRRRREPFRMANGSGMVGSAADYDGFLTKGESNDSCFGDHSVGPRSEGRFPSRVSQTRARGARRAWLP